MGEDSTLLEVGTGAAAVPTPGSGCEEDSRRDGAEPCTDERGGSLRGGSLRETAGVVDGMRAGVVGIAQRTLSFQAEDAHGEDDEYAAAEAEAGLHEEMEAAATERCPGSTPHARWWRH